MTRFEKKNAKVEVKSAAPELRCSGQTMFMARSNFDRGWMSTYSINILKKISFCLGLRNLHEVFFSLTYRVQDGSLRAEH